VTQSKTATTITATQLAWSLSDVLNRVRYQGERFTIERNGEVVAVLGPTEAVSERTVRDFVQFVQSLPPADPDYLDALEAIRANRPPPAEIFGWPD
jgi:antitoxin (DNA-binding transcriptional repressor) of toxin-antitoxin stability system